MSLPRGQHVHEVQPQGQQRRARQQAQQLQAPDVPGADAPCPQHQARRYQQGPAQDDEGRVVGKLRREQLLGEFGIGPGHELSHAFDYNGSQYDENGNAVNWWTDEDAAAFEERCQAVIDFYDGYEAAPGITTNGELTLTENTADMGGLSVATELASKMEDFDYEEMYESYANLWMEATYRGAMEQQAATDYHSLSSVRVNRMLETSDKFFETYGITEGDGMWVAPEDRVSIW